jgi:hypothetical protein
MSTDLADTERPQSDVDGYFGLDSGDTEAGDVTVKGISC